jgi:outer membrane lipoprotein-sorting protein
MSTSIASATTQRDAYLIQAKAWLSHLNSAKARFEQIDYQGQSIRGTFYINRPGKLRFEYDVPIKDYIVADGYLIHFYDGTSGQVNSGPIGSTLADFILRDGGGFDDKVTIKSVRERNDMVNITVSQTDQPGMGELVLNFKKEPFELKGWRIIDVQGLTTDVLLSNLDRTTKLNPSLFVMKNRNLNK